MNNDQPEIRKIDRMNVIDHRLDELVIHNPTMVHIEDMGDHYWMALYVDGEARRYVLEPRQMIADAGCTCCVPSTHGLYYKPEALDAWEAWERYMFLAGEEIA